jgi:DNA polymerase elongation subunit (family B)
MVVITFYNFNINTNANILEGFFKDVTTLKKYKIYINLPYYYMINENDISILEDLKDYKTIEYKDFIILSPEKHIIDITNYNDFKNISTRKYGNFILVISKRYVKELNNIVYNKVFQNYQWFMILKNLEFNMTYQIDDNYLHCNKFYDEEKFDNVFTKRIDYIPVIYNIFAFDIECFIPENGGFPDGYNSGISHISVVYKTTSEERYIYYNNENLVNLENEEFIEEHKKRNCKYIIGNEKYILQKFIDLYNSLEKDIVTTYNGSNFDFNIVNIRCTKYKIPRINIQLENMKLKKNKVTENKNLLDYIFLDLMNYVMKSFENILNKYGLNDISKYLLNCYTFDYTANNNNILLTLKDPETYFIEALKTTSCLYIDDIAYKILSIEFVKTSDQSNENIKITLEQNSEHIIKNDYEKLKVQIGKDDVSLGSMYSNYDNKICLEIGLYNLHDSALLIRIIESLSLINVIKAASNISYVPQSLVLKRYNASQIQGLTLKIALECKIVFYGERTYNIYEKFIGANVMVPKQKFVVDPIICLDINSLYPNNIIFGNMSPEKLLGVFNSNNVITLRTAYKLLNELYKFPNYFVIIINEEAIAPPYQIAVFDRTEQGLIPKILNYLLSERKKVNKLILDNLKNNKDFEQNDEYRRLDALQLQFKIRANSLYGLLGSDCFFIEGKIIGQACCALGRKIIKYIDKTIDGLEICEDGILFYDTNVLCPIKDFKKKVSLNIIDNVEDKIIIKLKSQYIDTDSNYVKCQPYNKKALSYLELSEEELKYSIENNISKEKLLDIKFNNYLKKLLEIGSILCDFINKNILFENIQTKFENVMFQAIFRSSKQYSGKVISIDNPSKIKDKQSGTMTRKRSYSLIHKLIIDGINNLIKKQLQYRNPVDEKLLKPYLVWVIKAYLNLFTSPNININEFIMSRKCNGTYKNPNNHNIEIVKEYNSHVGKMDEITVGSRYNYIYYTDNIENRYTVKPAGVTNYEFIVTDHKIENGYLTNNKVKILDETKKYRIFYELYFERIFSDIVKLYYNTDTFEYSLKVYRQLFGVSFDMKKLKI